MPAVTLPHRFAEPPLHKGAFGYSNTIKKDRPQAVFSYYNYIFSGAVQPINVMALCSTARVVSASFKRA